MDVSTKWCMTQPLTQYWSTYGGRRSSIVHVEYRSSGFSTGSHGESCATTPAPMQRGAGVKWSGVGRCLLVLRILRHRRLRRNSGGGWNP
jgi:hypothetical protein